MPPTNSTRESILANLETTLLAMIAGADYNYTPKAVSREYQHWDEVPEDKFPKYFVLDGDETPESETGNQVMSTFNPIIVGYIQVDTDPSKTINKFIRDARKKIIEDRKRGGYAIYTSVAKIYVPKPIMKPYGYFEMTLKIKYRYDSTNP